MWKTTQNTNILVSTTHAKLGFCPQAMNRHVGRIDDEIANNSKVLQSLDVKLSSLLKNAIVDKDGIKASPNVFQGSCSQHTSVAGFDSETPIAAFPRPASKLQPRDANTIGDVKKKLDMCVDLTLSDGDDANVKQTPIQGLNMSAAKPSKSGSQKTKTCVKKPTATKLLSCGKGLLKSLEVDFDVSDSDNEDCIIVESPTQTRKRTSGVNETPNKEAPNEDKKQVVHLWQY